MCPASGAVPWRRHLEALAVVAHPHGDTGAAPLQEDVHRAGVRVLADVRERLERDAVEHRPRLGRRLGIEPVLYAPTEPVVGE